MIVGSSKDFDQFEEDEKKRQEEIDDFIKQEKEEDRKKELELKKKEVENAKAAARREIERMERKMKAEKIKSKRKDGMSKKLRKYLFMGIGIIFVSILIALIITYFPKIENIEKVEGLPTCGDGTFYEKCSLSKPYYCAEGELVSNAILCGCPSELRKDEGECISKYYGFTDEEIALPYTLRGEDGYIPFTIYTGVSEYIDTLPRELYYNKGEIPRRDDFKLMKIEDSLQREILMPLIIGIRNAAPDSIEDQLRIAISVVQNIPYGEPEFTGGDRFNGLRLSRYPYQVILEGMGSCEGKSELLTLILRELGYESAMFYYQYENHEAVGIKCPVEYSLAKSGYCFVETTVPAPISYSTGNYLGITNGRLLSAPQIILINKGRELSGDMYEFDDARRLDSILSDNSVDAFESSKLDKLKEKYGLNYFG